MSDEPAGRDLSTAQRVRQFLVARFNPKSQLGLGLTASFVVFAFAAWAFSDLLDAILDNALLVKFDTWVENWFHAHATPTGVAVFGQITQFGSPVVDLLVIVVALYFLRERKPFLAWSWLGVTLGGKGVEYVLKNTVRRPRPEYSTSFLNPHSYSFPSAHAMDATICYLLLAYFISVRPGATKATSIIAFSVAMAIIVAVALSRLYLGVHYPSDVLGGFLGGVAWLAVCGATRRLIAGHLELPAQ